MWSILSVIMSSSDHMWAFTELSNITYDPPESNPTCSKDSTLEEIMWNIISFEILQKTKGLYLVWHLGGFFIALQLSLLEFGFSLLVLSFCLSKSVFSILIQFSLTFNILYSPCKNKPPNIRMVAESKKGLVKIHLDDSSLFVIKHYAAWNVLGGCAMSSWL